MKEQTEGNKPLHIVLADDDQDDRHFFKEALKELNISAKLTMLGNGQDLTDYLSKYHSRLPDLIFIDLNMPRKTGRQCLIEIKSNERLNSIPVVICSTSLHEEVADLIHQFGAHYYLQKCNFSELKKNIKIILDLLASDKRQPSRDKFALSASRDKSYNTKLKGSHREK